jgi:hypothetical protein
VRYPSPVGRLGCGRARQLLGESIDASLVGAERAAACLSAGSIKGHSTQGHRNHSKYQRGYRQKSTHAAARYPIRGRSCRGEVYLMAAQSTTVSTSAGPITVTTRDIEQYITGLAQTSTNPSNDPYTDHSGATTRTLSQSQLTAAMSALGYSKTQINNVISGNVGGGSWISDALQGLAGGLAAVGPAGSGLGDALDAIAGGGGDAADTTAAATEDATGAGAGASGGAGLLSGSALASLLSKFGGDVIWIPILTWITTSKNWVRVLEYVGGAVMIGIAMRELAKS